jgi:hypothetical protein
MQALLPSWTLAVALKHLQCSCFWRVWACARVDSTPGGLVSCSLPEVAWRSAAIDYHNCYTHAQRVEPGIASYHIQDGPEDVHSTGRSDSGTYAGSKYKPLIADPALWPPFVFGSLHEQNNMKHTHQSACPPAHVVPVLYAVNCTGCSWPVQCQTAWNSRVGPHISKALVPTGGTNSTRPSAPQPQKH